MDYREEIAQNIAGIREKMNAAARAAGRDPQEILLCAASKMNDADRVKAAVAGGVDCCGENRVQELTQKQPLGAYTGKPVHFIGHLQTNKVKQVVGAVDLIQSVDRLELLECIEKAAAKKGLAQDVLLEINIGQEESKSGFTVAESWEIAAAMSNYPHVRLRGLMAIPPVSEKKGIISDILPKCATFLLTLGQKNTIMSLWIVSPWACPMILKTPSPPVVR